MKELCTDQVSWDIYVMTIPSKGLPRKEQGRDDDDGYE